MLTIIVQGSRVGCSLCDQQLEAFMTIEVAVCNRYNTVLLLPYTAEQHYAEQTLHTARSSE